MKIKNANYIYFLPTPRIFLYFGSLLTYQELSEQRVVEGG
jgi:hypothetical protein